MFFLSYFSVISVSLELTFIVAFDIYIRNLEI